MKKLLIKKISLLTLLSFFSLLLTDAYPLAAGQAQDGLALVAKGEADYDNGLYQDALAAFNQALSLVPKGDDHERLLLDISLAHYALKDLASCRDVLRSLLQLNAGRQIDMTKLPEGFVQLYGQVFWQVQETKAELKKLEEQKRVAAAVPGAVEKAQTRAQFKKKKKFPWLWVILGVGVVTAVILLLGKKKSSDLTVTLAAGVNGSPAAGTYHHANGTKVDYSYTTASADISVEVKLDGTVVAASGSITMDKDHVLEVTTVINYALTVTLAEGVSGTPAAGAYKYGNGAKVDYSYTLASGYSALEVKLDGAVVAASGSITMSQDHVLAVTARGSNFDYDTKVLGIKWCSVPAGQFKMGDSHGAGDSWERPVHQVNLSAYSISKYEVTFAQYDAFCTATKRSKPSDKGWGRGSMPVINVTWNDATAFCDWLSTKTGKNIHLATEAQWERAAAGTNQRLYPWGSAAPSCSYANYSGCAGRTKKVGSSPAGASAVGAQDMAGNAWEWVQDWFSDSYYQECNELGTVNNPQGPGNGSNRVLRSGSYTVKIVRLRCSFRDYNFPDYASPSVSFRVVWEN